ncbi:hypothetical protein JCGZ_24219 [Jatropha curcas]|uniref:Uncharacterized protein n=1 Tax=Jatropha curcas TaxID=180498 RepID=A0A067L7V4_JATCU|nr:hypothetical protein JCGZ_24219 [Jatropha curcas]
MWMSGQPGAGTSYSDPPPTTDRDVSTALHHPLPSPLDPKIADDTLVTAADTTTHPADTPPGATTLDRADDQSSMFKQHHTKVIDFRDFQITRKTEILNKLEYRELPN